ncbi:MAG TPA: DUF6580 family putative transport protein [Cytophagaceae bacterium]|jgi:hypothetical protein|nr:DUF6580 family putative transport protein [Cytophagaceae bacterium]
METSSKINVRFSVVVGLIALAAFSRMIPHIFNFSPLGAIGLFGAAYFSKKWQAFLIPVAAIWLSDLFITNVIYGQSHTSFVWFYDGFYWQYGSFALITLVGFFIFRKVSLQRILAGTLLSTTIFFLVTNFGCFPNNPIYTQDFNGLITCYAAGIPFINGTLFGDLFYSGLLFGSFAILQQRFTILKLALAK